MKWKSAAKIFLPVVGIVLFVLHGLGEEVVHFRIDLISFLFLVIAASPFLARSLETLASYLDTLRVGNVEAHFRKLSFIEQVFTFLTVLATDRKLTFYGEREGEFRLGTAGQYLLEEMFSRNRRRTYHNIRHWLQADEENLRWFAAEVMGYFKLQDLSQELPHFYQNLDRHKDWPEWALNCIWAHSKLNNEYKELNDFLLQTKSSSNQDWLLDIYTQMPEAGEAFPLPSHSEILLKQFRAKTDLSKAIEYKTERKLEQLAELMRKKKQIEKRN